MNFFAHPERLLMLAALVPMAAWVARGARRRRQDWKRLGQAGRPGCDGGWWRVVASALIVVALAQPRWGRAVDPSEMVGRDVVLLVDVSRSMAAEDAIPDRLGVAIASATSLLDAIAAEPGNRVAVVAFAGRGVVRCPLTFQVGAAADAVRSLRAGEVQPGETDLGAAIDAALGAFDQEDHAGGRTVVVFSDGEDLAGTASAAEARLRDSGVVVHAVAIGDPDRAYPVPSRPGGSPMTYRGQPVATRRSDAPLDALARASGGAMIRLGLVPSDLGALFRDRIDPVAGRLRGGPGPGRRVERFPAFALAALACTLAGSWPGRARRRVRLIPILGLAALPLAAGAGRGGESAASLVARGRDEYDAGRFAEALTSFQRAGGLEPSSPIPPYDAAAALFQLGRFPEAVAAYERARDGAGPGLRIKVDYALGNARLASGDVAGALKAYDDCLTSTLPGPAYDAVRHDAGLNRAFAATRLADPPRSPDDEEGGGKGSDRPRPRRSGERGGGDASPDAKTGPAPGAEVGDPSAPPGSRGRGGQGGGGSAPPEAGSPGARLDAALRAAREARRLRPADVPGTAPSKDIRDW